MPENMICLIISDLRFPALFFRVQNNILKVDFNLKMMV